MASPHDGRVRTRFSDDLLWLPFVTSFYISVTADGSVLDEVTPFLEMPLLGRMIKELHATIRLGKNRNSF